MPTIGAYLFGNDLSRLNQDSLSIYKSFGVNTIFSEADNYPLATIEMIQAEGLRFMGGLTCFHNTQLAKQNPDYRPITADSNPRPQINWYIGIRPTNQNHQADRLDTVNHMLSTYPLDGLWLDFVRWSMHWEVELREDTPPPLHTSFDPDTMAQFAQWADVDLPQKSTAELAQWILTENREQWTVFKCHVITQWVSQIKNMLNQQRPTIPLGVNLVPATASDRREYLGQDINTLSASADVFSPMLYHHILGCDVQWIHDRLDEMSDQSNKPLIPFVQVSALGDNDDDFSTAEWESVVQTVLNHRATHGLIAFTGDRLHEKQRGLSLGKYL